MAAYDDLMEWFKDSCMMLQEEFEELLKAYEEEIRIETCKRITNMHYGIPKPISITGIPKAYTDSIKFNPYIGIDSSRILLLKEIEENETETESNCTNPQNPAGASLSDTEG